MRSLILVLPLTITSVLFNPWAVALEQRSLEQPGLRLTQSVGKNGNRVTARNGTYYFTITLPQKADRRFARLSFSFTQPGQPNQITPLSVDLSSTQVFMGRGDAVGQAIALAETWVDETGVLWVELKPSLAPGSHLTVAIKPTKFPAGAAYQYGIAAYPDITNPVPVFVGDGILTTVR